MRVFKPIQLTYSDNLRASYEVNLTKQQKNITELKECLTAYKIECENWNAFKENPTGALYELVRSTFGKDFPSYLTDEKLVEFISFDKYKFNLICKNIAAIDIDIDYNTLSSLLPEFGIFTTNEIQNEALTKITKAIDCLNDMGVQIYGLDLQRATSNVIVLDTNTGKLKANTNYILQLQ